jgi:hypothetical protein
MKADLEAEILSPTQDMIMLPVPRGIFNRMLAFANTIGADLQVVLTCAIDQHVVTYHDEKFTEEQKAKMKKLLDIYRKEQ